MSSVIKPRRMLYLIGFGLALLVVANYFTNGARKRIHHFGDSELGIVAAADRAEVYRLLPPKPASADGSPASARDPLRLPLAGSTVTKGPSPAPMAWAARMQQLILQCGNVPDGPVKLCLPRPGAAVRFYHGDETVDLLICLECDMVALDRPGEHGHERWADCDQVRQQLIEMLLEVFPEDSEIRALQGKR